MTIDTSLKEVKIKMTRKASNGSLLYKMVVLRKKYLTEYGRNDNDLQTVEETKL